MGFHQLSFEDLGSVAQLRENYDVELKAAQGRHGNGAVPDSVWETYSAFANTKGGWIVLGVAEIDDGLDILGINDIDRVTKEIWDSLNNRQKVSTNILQNPDVRGVEESGETIIVIRVPTADRKQRPVYIGTNPYEGTYLRNFEGDYTADEGTVRRMLAEATIGSRDSATLPNFGLEDLDHESLEQYRNLFRSTSPQHPFLERNDRELLRSLGGVKLDRESDTYELTVAGLLMFGKFVSISEEFPHYTLDYQEHLNPSASRWSHRLTTDGSWSGNLFQFFRKTYPRLASDVEVPFQLDADMQRMDETEVHEALREALVNCLIHADYEATTPIRIVKSPTSFEFRNPGRLRVPKKQAFAGGISDCRNPSIQKMFQMIGAGEKAGSGIPTIVRAWKEQHWRAPSLEEDITQEMTTLTLPLASLLPEEAVAALEDTLGDQFRELERQERIVLVTNWLEEKLTHERLMQILDIHSRDLTLMLEKLVREDLLVRRGTGRGCYYELGIGTPGQSQMWDADQTPNIEQSSSSNSVTSPSNKPANLSTNDNSPSTNEEPEDEDYGWKELRTIAEPIRQTQRVSDRSRMENVILDLCKEQPLNVKQLAELLERNPDGLRNNYLSPLVAEGRLRLKHPERLSHPEQAYITVEEE